MQKKGPNVVCLTLHLLGLYMAVFNTIDIMSLQEEHDTTLTRLFAKNAIDNHVWQFTH